MASGNHRLAPPLPSSESIRVREECEARPNGIIRNISVRASGEFPPELRIPARGLIPPPMRKTFDTIIDRDGTYHAQQILPILAVPCYVEMFAHSLTSISPFSPIRWRNENVCADVEILVLTNCCLDVPGMDTLLSRTPLLREFKYIHAVNANGNTSHFWDAKNIVDTIELNAGYQLESLTIGVDHKRAPRCITRVESLRNFAKLKKLDIDLIMLKPQPILDILRRTVRKFVLQVHTPRSSACNYIIRDVKTIFSYREPYDMSFPSPSSSIVQSFGDVCQLDDRLRLSRELGEWAKLYGINYCCPPTLT